MRLLLFFFPLLSLFCVPLPETGQSPTPYFITGDNFRLYADFAFDLVDRSLNPKSITPKSTVFVHGDLLDEYFTKIHPLIESDYILIMHNSDAVAPGPYRAVLDEPKLIAWFSINLEGEPHPKLHSIPLGIANRSWPFGDTDALKKERAISRSKEHLLYFNLTIQNHLPERWAAYQHLISASYCYRPMKKRFHLYIEDVASSKFIVAPRGVGPDTYRFWESLYLGSYPVVKTSSLDPLYQNFPVLILQNWKDLSEGLLNQAYETLKEKTFDLKKLDIQYWLDLIDSYKKLP